MPVSGTGSVLDRGGGKLSVRRAARARRLRASRDRHQRGLLVLGEPRAQLLRRRELHGRACRGGAKGSRAVPLLPAREAAALSRGARARGARSGLRQRAQGDHAGCRADGRLRHLHGSGGRHLARAGQAARASHRLCARLRPGDQSIDRHRAGREFRDIRAHRRAVGRDQPARGTLPADELRQLPADAHVRGAEIDTFILPSTEAPGGIGEPATALVAPAVGNAVFTATGKRLRSLPFARHRLA